MPPEASAFDTPFNKPAHDGERRTAQQQAPPVVRGGAGRGARKMLSARPSFLFLPPVVSRPSNGSDEVGKTRRQRQPDDAVRPSGSSSTARQPAVGTARSRSFNEALDQCRSSRSVVAAAQGRPARLRAQSAGAVTMGSSPRAGAARSDFRRRIQDTISEGVQPPPSAPSSKRRPPAAKLGRRRRR